MPARIHIRKIICLSFAYFFFSYLLTSGQNHNSNSLLIIREDSRGKGTTLELLKEIRNRGGRPLLVFRDFAILIENLEDSEGIQERLSYVDLITDSPIDISGFSSSYDDSLDIYALRYWNSQFKSEPISKTLRVESDDTSPIISDFLENPYIANYEKYGLDSLPPVLVDYVNQNPHEKDKLLLSDVEGASGYIAGTVFFPESVSDDPNENTENWTEVNWITGYTEMVQALQWWASKAPTSANLTFNIGYYAPQYCPTDVEPILHNGADGIPDPLADEGEWIHDVMWAIGFRDLRIFWWLQVISFNDWICNEFGTDASYAIFLVNSLNDPDGDGRFADGYFAYAYRGGPFMIMTWDNDGWRGEFRDDYGSNYEDLHLRWIGAHESGHIFQAPDEYAGPEACDGPEDCTDPVRHGFPNGNCEACNSSPESSIMRQDDDTRPLLNQNYPYDSPSTGDTKISYWARGIIGWGETGNLVVETTPVAGEIYVDGDFMMFGGWSGYVAPGSYTVSFGDYNGYITPDPQTVNVSSHGETVVTGIYVGNSDISVSTNTIPNPCYPYELLTLTGTAYYNSGQPVSNATAAITMRETGAQYTAPVINGSFSTEFPAPGSPGPYHIDTEVDDGSLPPGQYTELLTVLSGEGGSGYTYGYDVMCRDVQIDDPYLPIYEIYSFEERDETALCWVEINDVYEPVQFKFEWYTPSGELFQYPLISEWTDDPQDYGYDYWGWWRIAYGWYVSGSILQYEGLWEIRIFIRTQTSGWTYHSSQHMTLRYDLREHVMCKNVEDSYPYDYIEPTNTFLQTDTYAYTWMRLDTLSVLIDVMWEFYEPNGSQYTTFDTFFVDPESQGYDFYDWYKIWGRIWIDNHSAENKCGNWSVNVYIKDAWGAYELVYQDYFQILENPNVDPFASVSLSPQYPNETEPISINVSASDNTYIDRVTLYYSINGTGYEQTWDDIFNSTYSNSIVLGTLPQGTQVQYYARVWDTSNNDYVTNIETIMIVDDDVAPPDFSNYMPEEIDPEIPFIISVYISDPSGVYDDDTGSDGQGVYLLWDEDGELIEDYAAEVQFDNVSGDEYEIVSEIPGQPLGAQFIYQVFAYDNDYDYSNAGDRSQGASIQQILELPSYAGPIWYVSPDGDDVSGNGSESSPFATIQRGIDAAGEGDTVLVDEGTYMENIDFLGKAILVTSGFLINRDTLDIANTVINGSLPNDPDSASVVIIIGSQSSELAGFTITGGSGILIPGSFGDHKGGGVFIESSAASISYCRVSSNTGHWGGGIFLSNSDLAIDSCKITYNSVGGQGPRGGGVYSDSSDLTISNSEIHLNNSEGVEPQGGGVNFSSGNLEITNSLIAGHTIITGSGGGVSIVNGYAVMESVTIRDNWVNYDGGGSACYGSELSIKNSVIENNHGRGGAIYLTASNGIIDSNQIAGNSGDGEEGNSGGGIVVSHGSMAHISDNLFLGNSAGIGAAILQWPGGGGEAIVKRNRFIRNDSYYPGGYIVRCIESDSLCENNFGGNTGSSLVALESSPFIIDNIFLNDSLAESYFDPEDGGEALISYNDFYPDSCSGCLPENGNIFEPPEFEDTTYAAVLPFSPCIDAGNPGFPLDPDGSRADIGAFWYDHGMDVPAHAPGGPGDSLVFVQNGDSIGTVIVNSSGGLDSLRLIRYSASAPELDPDDPWVSLPAYYAAFAYPEAAENYDLDVIFIYSDDELAAAGIQNESTLVLVRSEIDPIQWDDYNGVTSVDQDANEITAHGVTDLSLWSIIGDPTIPPPCVYTPGDVNHNGAPLELADVVAMIGNYRGTEEPYYTCDCGDYGPEFPAVADANGNCAAMELADVVTEIGAYRGTAEASGCPDCPGSLRLEPGAPGEPAVIPRLKSKVKTGNGRVSD